MPNYTIINGDCLTELPKLTTKSKTNYRVPYITISPTYSICTVHGYLEGEHFECPKCKAEKIAELQKRLAALEDEKAKLIEEMGELKEAIEKWDEAVVKRNELIAKPLTDKERMNGVVRHSGEKCTLSLDNMAEEATDVEICLHHLKHLMGKAFKARVAEYRKQKIARQLRRMEAGE